VQDYTGTRALAECARSRPRTASGTWQIIDFPPALPAPIVAECAFVFALRGS
jgi:hypothetical protein